MKLDRPIFILGTGRCGSTLLHNVFTHHPQLCFLSGLTVLYPNKPYYNRCAMRLMDVPLVRRYARKKFRPAEHWPFWDHYVRGFSVPCRDLIASDVRPNEAARMHEVLGQMLTPRRRRLLAKLSGWPRLGFLAEMFPDARFVHIIRDGRAVVNSLLNVNFWQGWRGPEFIGLGELTSDERDEWEASGQSFVVLAAIQWRRFMDAFEAAKLQIAPSQYMEIRYRNLVDDPVGTFADVLDFCELDASPSFLRYVERFPMRDQNGKWQQELTPEQQRLLCASLKRHLARYGYEGSLEGPLATGNDEPVLSQEQLVRCAF